MKQRTNMYTNTSISPPSRVTSRTDFSKSGIVPSSEIDSLLAENSKLSDRLRDLTDLIEANNAKTKGVSDLETKLDMMINNNVDQAMLDEKLEKLSLDIKAALISKQKTYEEQYHLLEKRYHKLKEAQEQQFFKFTHIISNYQMLIFKMMSTQSTMLAPEEVQKLNELMTEVGGSGGSQQQALRNKFSYTPAASESYHEIVHTPHPNAGYKPSSLPGIRKHHSAVNFKLNIPKKLEEEVLSENDTEYTSK